jgi:hypothetical protein
LNQVLTVATDAPVVYESAGPDQCLPRPLTVAVYPESGGTVTVEQRIAATGEWKPATGNLAGTISADLTTVLDGAISGLKFTAAVAAASIEIASR